VTRAIALLAAAALALPAATAAAPGKRTCSWAGASRARVRPIGRLWTFHMEIRLCWNGRNVVRYDSWNAWIDNAIGVPGNHVYTLHHSNAAYSNPGPLPFRDAYYTATMVVEVCLILRPVCSPAINTFITVYARGDGYVTCTSDTGPELPCLGDRQKQGGTP
jgi:hypothetical protein